MGATKGMGRALAREMAGRGASLCLLGRNLEDLQRSASDLLQRGAAQVEVTSCDLERPETFAPALDAADAALQGGVDTVVVTAGLFGTQEALQDDLELARRVLIVNHAHTVVFCEHVRQRLLARGGGTLCVFSSVAGDRGRKPVGLYGSSKAGLSHYLESLDHRYRAEGLVTIWRQARVREDVDDRGAQTPAVCGRARRGCEAGDAGHRSQTTAGVRALDLGMDPVRDPPLASLRDAPRRVLARRY